jgi:hypothetical protein
LPIFDSQLWSRCPPRSHWQALRRRPDVTWPHATGLEPTRRQTRFIQPHSPQGLPMGDPSLVAEFREEEKEKAEPKVRPLFATRCTTAACIAVFCQSLPRAITSSSERVLDCGVRCCR